MPELPPLLADRPPAHRAPLIIVPALLLGFLAGAMLGVSAAAWAIVNVVATLGGIAAGFEHDGAASGARRGALGGLVFGLGVVLADALLVDHREAKLADPAILQPLVTTVAGALLGALGGRLRARVIARAGQPALARSTTPKP
jgi:hypothetical protein